MKVSDKKAGGVSAKVDSAKSARSDAARSNSSAGASALSGTASAKGGAKVDVSERAQMMQKARDVAGGTDVDEAKVARLQKMIDDGNYKVDSGAVADRLVDEHLLIPD